jgi:hypothetical protein
LSLSDPDQRGGEADRGAVDACEPVGAHRDSAPLLETVEAPFDDVAAAVPPFLLLTEVDRAARLLLAVGGGDHDQDDEEPGPVARSTSEWGSGTRVNERHANVPLRRVRAGELRWEKLLYELKAGPAARRRHDGHRGTGLTVHIGWMRPRSRGKVSRWRRLSGWRPSLVCGRRS